MISSTIPGLKLDLAIWLFNSIAKFDPDVC